MKLSKKIQLYLYQYLKNLVNTCCGEISFKYECCNSSKVWRAYLKDEFDVVQEITYKLKNEHITALEYFRKDYKNTLSEKVLKFICCFRKKYFLLENDFSILRLKTFLDTNTPGYPVGVFNVNGDYIGTATDQTEYITVWNSDVDNQLEGILQAGSNSLEFKLPPTSTISGVIGLRYYTWQGGANNELFVGANDIAVYNSDTVIKKGNIDGTLISTDSRREWNGNLFTYVAKQKVNTDSVYTLACAGYLNNTPLKVFHNEDSKYVGSSHSIGMYSISGNFPIGLLAFYGICQQTTNYNLISNLNECSSLYSININHVGGTPWILNNESFLPNLNQPSSINQLQIGQMGGTVVLSDFLSRYTNTNYPNVKELVLTQNTSANLMSGNTAWFLTMPKVDKYFRYYAPGASELIAAEADEVWNNIATALNGVVPVGSVKELRIEKTANVTAASLTARNYLTSQGWTILTA